MDSFSKDSKKLIHKVELKFLLLYSTKKGWDRDYSGSFNVFDEFRREKL